MLGDWPNNPYSYFMLSRAEGAMGDTAASAEAIRHARVEWIGGEMSLPAA